MKTSLTRLRTAIVALAAAIVLVTGCTATPLPTPPTARAERMSLTEGQPMRLAFSGSAGAIPRGATSLRITTRTTAVTTPVAPDGSFLAMLAGSRRDIFWLEVIETDDDVFAGAFTGVVGSTEVMDADAGPDGDTDESPDAVDCDSADPALRGRRCPTACGLPELCGDGVDSDCDGASDEGCGSTCVADADCGAAEMCCAGSCSDLNTDALNCGTCGNACAPAEMCTFGACMMGCDPTTAGPEICGDRINNDCDGVTDEPGCM